MSITRPPREGSPVPVPRTTTQIDHKALDRLTAYRTDLESLAQTAYAEIIDTLAAGPGHIETALLQCAHAMAVRAQITTVETALALLRAGHSVEDVWGRLRDDQGTERTIGEVNLTNEPIMHGRARALNVLRTILNA